MECSKIQYPMGEKISLKRFDSLIPLLLRRFHETISDIKLPMG